MGGKDMQKKINIFIIILLVMTVFFGFMSSPVVATMPNVVNWDDYSVGSYSGAGTFYTFQRDYGNDATVQIHSINGSAKSMYFRDNSDMHDPDKTSIDFVYNDSTTVTSIKFYFDLYKYSPSITLGDDVHVIFSFYEGSTKKIDFRFYRIQANNWLQWLDANGSWINIETGVMVLPRVWYQRLVFINYSYTGSYGSVFDIDVINITSGAKFSKTSTFAEWEGQWNYFDELEIAVDGGSYGSNRGDIYAYVGAIEVYQTGYEESVDYPVDQWDYIGDLILDGYGGLPYVGLEEQYQIPITCEIKAVDLFVSADQYIKISSNLNEYAISINGDWTFHNQPVAFIPYHGHYLLRWYWINKSIENEYLTFEFACAGENPENNANWDIIISESDNDNDGETTFRYGEDGDAWFNGLFDQPYIFNYDASMRFYYIGDLYEPPYNYTDWIGIKNNPPYYTNTSIPISYSISTKEYDNYMEIWREGERVGDEQGFGSTGENGLLLTDTSETIGFVPYVSGSYSVNIRRNSINVTVYAFTVLENPITDYYIYTIPNPSQRPNVFKVCYKYFHGEGKNGILTINPIQDFSDPLSHSYVLFLDANTSGNFSYTPQQYYDLLYISLGVEISTELYTLASFPRNPYLHYIKDYSSANYIEVSEDIIIMEESNIQTVTGHHNHISAYVYVMDNGEIIRDVSSENSFVFSYRVIHAGHHKVELIVSTANGSLILATDYYNAKETEEEEEEDDFAVLGEYKIWLGVGIIVLCLLLPLVISIKSFVDVPIIVYIAMASIGTGISVSLGLLEMYWLLLLIVALVSGAVISKWG